MPFASVFIVQFIHSSYKVGPEIKGADGRDKLRTDDAITFSFRQKILQQR
jgi:hypothetical protein